MTERTNMANTHLIFLVHGMGDFTQGWSESAQQTIRDQYATYTQLKFIPFGQRFEFVELNYNDEFEALREMWRKMAKDLGAALVAGGGEVGKKAEDKEVVARLGKVATVTNKNTFLNTHVVDALLYFAARQTAATVRESIREQIFTALKKQVDAGQTLRWSIIAHSLGTAVIHDALHEAYSDQPTAKGAKLAGITRPTCLAMIANVSRLLEWDIDVFLSRTRPGNPDDPEAACRCYINAHNIFDPFTQPKPFQPAAQWPSLGIRALGLYHDAQISAIEAPEKVHDLDHYLRNPRVHGPIFNCLVGQDVLDKDTIDDAHARYIALTPLGQFADFVKALKRFQLGDESSWVDIFERWAALKELIASAGGGQ
jgi:hypothetical protein